MNPTFENVRYTPESMAKQLRAAYEAGRDGGQIRPAYRELADVNTREPSRTTPARIRRRLSRMISPDHR